MSETPQPADKGKANTPDIDSEFHLEERDGDIPVTDELMGLIGLFNGLTAKVKSSRYPGAMKIRSYFAGQTVCKMGDEGGTAYYILTAKDEAQVKAVQARKSSDADQTASTKTSEVPDETARDQHVLSVLLPSSTSKSRQKLTAQAQPKGMLGRWFAPIEQVVESATSALIFDGDAEIDADTPDRLRLKGGDIFGEMSCKSHAPRSATVTAHVDCLLLEMNRNVFEKIDSDKKYKDENFTKFKARTLDTFLRQLDLFRNLDEEQIGFLNKHAELQIVDAGKVICKEGELATETKPLDVFIVRNGVVQVTKHHRFSLNDEDILDWTAFCKAIEELNVKVTPEPEKNSPSSGTSATDTKKSSPLDKVRKGGPAPAKSAAEGADNQASNVDEKPKLTREPSESNGLSAQSLVKLWLNDHVLAAVNQIATRQLSEDELRKAKDLMLSALDELAGNSNFLSDPRVVAIIRGCPQLLRKTATFRDGLAGIKGIWPELELRSTGLDVLTELFPMHLVNRTGKLPPPRVLKYLTRGDCFGEIAVVTSQPRIASCIAYSHPSAANKTINKKKKRKFGNVELVRIPGAAFLKLLQNSDALIAEVNALVNKHLADPANKEQDAQTSDFVSTPDFQNMGLFQGNSLLVIDLDRCTRCGDCVEACEKTHDDNMTRLFLDGPRYDRFLVPSACRSCWNPVCMIDCPVGSIRRGGNGQIEIKDWCIGCGICAEDCPYDSIQMHDRGMIREDSHAWRYAKLLATGTKWYKRKRFFSLRSDDYRWKSATSPIVCDSEFHTLMLTHGTTPTTNSEVILGFWHEFRLPKRAKNRSIRLSINSKRDKYSILTGMKVISRINKVYLNESDLDWKPDQAYREFEPDSRMFKRGVNRLAVELSLDSLKSAEYFGNLILSAGIDIIPEANQQTKEELGITDEENQARLEMKIVANRAVVCDLCSHLPGKAPACVSSCPHDAAIRVDPLIDFPK